MTMMLVATNLGQMAMLVPTNIPKLVPTNMAMLVSAHFARLS